MCSATIDRKYFFYFISLLKLIVLERFLLIAKNNLVPFFHCFFFQKFQLIHDSEPMDVNESNDGSSDNDNDEENRMDLEYDSEQTYNENDNGFPDNDSGDEGDFEAENGNESDNGSSDNDSGDDRGSEPEDGNESEGGSSDNDSGDEQRFRDGPDENNVFGSYLNVII